MGWPALLARWVRRLALSPFGPLPLFICFHAVFLCDFFFIFKSQLLFFFTPVLMGWLWGRTWPCSCPRAASASLEEGERLLTWGFVSCAGAVWVSAGPLPTVLIWYTETDGVGSGREPGGWGPQNRITWALRMKFRLSRCLSGSL